MQVGRSGLGLVVAVCVLVVPISACGSDPQTAPGTIAPVSAPAPAPALTTTIPGAIVASDPTTPGVAGAGSPEELLPPDLPLLDGPARTYAWPGDRRPTRDDLDRLADALGVEGDVRDGARGPAGGWSLDGDNLTLTLDGGPEGAWSYSGPPPFPWPSEDEPWPTIETGEPVTVAPAFPMPGAPLPDSYPSRAEARTLARAIVEELGHDPDAFEWRDGPSSVARTVEAWWIIDGHTTPVKMELGFGPDGMLVFASGQLVAPDAGPVAERIGTAAAEDRLRAEIERMRAQPLGLGNTLVGGVVVAGDPDAPVVLADPDQPPLTGAPIDGGSGTTAPVPTVPPDMVGRIVDVESSWTTNHDDDGPRLLPSYTFIEATGMRYTVSALA